MGKNILKIIKNKFLLTIIGLGVWLTFFDRNDIFTQYDLKQQVNKLDKEKNYYVAEIASNKKNIEELQTNQKSLEKFARETYNMKKDNEEVFVIVKKWFFWCHPELVEGGRSPAYLSTVIANNVKQSANLYEIASSPVASSQRRKAGSGCAGVASLRFLPWTIFFQWISIRQKNQALCILNAIYS